MACAQKNLLSLLESRACTGWWSLGLTRAQLLCVSKTCPLRLPWSGGFSTHPVVRPWLLIAWAVFWFPFLYGLLPLRAGLCLIVGFSFFSSLFCSFLQSCYHFLLHYSAIPAVMSFGPSLLGFFGPAACSSLNDSAWSLSFFFVTLLAGSWVPFISSWASLAHLLSLGFLGLFPDSMFPWAFTNFFGFL